MVELFEKFLKMDRRWVFLGMGFAILLPLLFPVNFPFKVDERVQSLYDAVEQLPEGSVVLVSTDYDPGSAAELTPFYRANLHHLFRKNLRVVEITLWQTAPPLVKPILDDIAAEHGKKYGEDYAFLGYTAGKEAGIKLVGENILQAFPMDSSGVPTSSLPIMRGIRQAKDFALLVNISAGFPGTREYVLQIQGQYSLRMVSSTTSVTTPEYVPFYKAHQLIGLSGGMPGSAQYEKLVFPDGPPAGERLAATENFNVLNAGHVYIIVLILFGNIAYLSTRKREA